MNEKMVLNLVASSFGSAMTSPLCPIEHDCVYFKSEDGTVRYQWFTGHDRAVKMGFKQGMKFRVEAFVSERNTLSHVKISEL